MRKLILILLASLTMAAVGCGKTAEEPKQTERTAGEAVTYTGNDLILVASDGDSELYLNPSNATLRWKNRVSGAYHDTRIFDPEASDDTLKNDLIAYYYTGTKSNPYASSASMDTYNFSVDRDGVTYEKIDNGVKVVYFIGNNKVTYKDFPYRITDERMQELVIQYLDDKELKALKKQFRQNMDTTWSRTSNENNPINGLGATQLYKIFYEKGHYTYDELLKDNTEWEKLDEMPQRQEITLAMDYALDGGDLVVSINTAEIAYNSDFPLKSLSVLPFFLSSKSQDGYLFVPDGPGALIDFDNTKIKEYQFTSRFYNGDVLQTASNYSTTNASLMAPVFGMKDGDHAVLGIIESGAEMATLSAYVKNSFNSVPYSRLSLSFAIREDQTLASYVNALTNFTLRRMNSDYFNGLIKIRYRFLEGDDASYSGMALAYREYLLKRNELKQNTAEEKAPLFVELLGYTDATKYFLGIPYKGKTVITDFKAAAEILEDMNARSIENIKVDYRGMANGGTLQRSAEKVSISSELGGKSGLKKLINKAEDAGNEIFPDFQLQTANTAKKLSKDKRAFFISGEVAQLYDFRLVSRKPDTEDEYPTFLISPLYIATYINNFSKSYSKLGIENLASEDYMTFITSESKKDNNMSLPHATTEFLEGYDTLAEKFRLMLSNPMSAAWKGVTYITDLPFTGLDLKVVDHYVPFIQMVLSGSITYSSERFNNNSYDMTEQIMKSIEYGSAPKFRFIGTDIGTLENTEENAIFMAEYSSLAENAAEVYKEYAAFYDKVRGARLTDHRFYNGNDKLVITTWSNGVKICLNYTDEEAKIDGISVAPLSYVIR